MTFFRRFAFIWLAMWMWGLLFACINTLHVFAASMRYSIFGCLVFGCVFFFLAFIGSRGRK